ncbi:MAG: phosphoribosylanthranilate isomerase [Woeseiaceae bacterium]|nr:phosphoribosylanthranilate isomerase [Woeseiaceae bacterium]
MSLMVKICGLRTADDVAAAEKAGANAVGFVFAESVRRVTPGEARAACSELPPTVRRVAVMKHPPQALVDEVVDVFAPDVVQTDVEDFENISVPDGVETWPVFRQGITEPRDQATFLYEGRVSGSGTTVDWQVARSHTGAGNMILAGGLAPDNVAESIRQVRPFGVDVSSGVESAPGVKDHDRIHAFIRAARAAESNA